VPGIVRPRASASGKVPRIARQVPLATRKGTLDRDTGYLRHRFIRPNTQQRRHHPASVQCRRGCFQPRRREHSGPGCVAAVGTMSFVGMLAAVKEACSGWFRRPAAARSHLRATAQPLHERRRVDGQRTAVLQLGPARTTTRPHAVEQDRSGGEHAEGGVG